MPQGEVRRDGTAAAREVDEGIVGGAAEGLGALFCQLGELH